MAIMVAMQRIMSRIRNKTLTDIYIFCIHVDIYYVQ